VGKKKLAEKFHVFSAFFMDMRFCALLSPPKNLTKWNTNFTQRE